MENGDVAHGLELAPEYDDGEIVGVLPGGAGHLLLVPGSARPAYFTRSLEEARNWRARCRCGGWESPPILRVPTHADEDLPSLRVYAADPGRLPERADVVATVTELWTRDHLGPMDAVAAVEDAQRRVEAALNGLDDAVSAARRAGATWGAIGRAAGMTRQSAHGRWARLSTRSEQHRTID